MGICKFQDIWKTLFSWVLPVPENAHKAKCKYCPGKLIDIKCGSQALKRHKSGNFCSWFKYCGPNAGRYLCGRRKTQSSFTSLPQTCSRRAFSTV